jgi:hypothetical protein
MRATLMESGWASEPAPAVTGGDPANPFQGQTQDVPPRAARSRPPPAPSQRPGRPSSFPAPAPVASLPPLPAPLGRSLSSRAPANRTPLPAAPGAASRTPLPLRSVPPAPLRGPAPAGATPLPPPPLTPATRTPFPFSRSVPPLSPATATPLPATATPHPALGSRLPAPPRSIPPHAPSSLAAPSTSVAPPAPSSFPPADRVPAFPPPSSVAPQIDPSRGLPQYAREGGQHAEATHIDRDVQARARAMNRLPAAASVAPASVAPRAPYDGSVFPAGGRVAIAGFGSAMRARVRFAGGEVPLWSLVVPLVIVAALTAAFAASAVSVKRAQVKGLATAGSGESPAGSASSATDLPTDAAAFPAAPSARPEPRDVRPLDVSQLPPAHSAPALAPSADFEAAPEKYMASELLAFAESRSRSALVSAQEFESALDRDPGLVKEPKTIAELRRLSENPETARVALGAVAKLPGSLSADILYELWTGTVEKTETTELARTLLFSRDVRPKASPALAVALDLRAAERCEEAKAILPRAVQEADRRALHLIIKLQRKYGCGPNKRQDCYPCLRKGDDLESAIKAVKERPEPKTLSRR